MNSWDTWECDICGETRPDACISVYKRTQILEDSITFTENIRFCNDRQPCIQQAPHHTRTKQKIIPGDKTVPNYGYDMNVALTYVLVLVFILILLWWLFL